MERYLYQDLFELENSHWWHIAKRRTALGLLQERLKPGARLLDLGCGTGQNLVSFSQLSETYGIDVEAEAVSWCKKRRLKNVKQGSAYAIPFPNRSFDAVTLLDVLEHTDEDQALPEVFRVLKPGGLVLISVPAFQWLWSRWDEVLHHHKRYTKSSLCRALHHNGFRPLVTSYAYSFLVPPVWIVRKLKSWRNQDQYVSDFRLGNPTVNTLLGKMADLERPFVLKGQVPLGTSVFTLAKKP